MSVGEAELAAFLELHRRRFARDPDRIEWIDAEARQRGARSVLVARDADGHVRAGGYFVHDERFTTYLLAATDAEARGAASLVLWEAIKRASARGNAFDFEGSMLRHVESFVRSFGGVPTPYSIVWRTSSAPMRAARLAKRTLRRR
jgi:hypothetical protein